VIGAVLAARAGAFCYAVAAALQQHEAVRTTTRGIANPAMLWQLAHRPWWLAAIAAQGLGASLHLLALSFGPLTFVQPLGVTTLLFAVPLAALLHHHRVQLAELAAALIVLTGLALLLSVLPPGTGAGAVDAEPVSIMIVAAIALTATAVALAKVVSGRLRSLLLASGAGISFGVTSALARVVLQTVGQPGSTVTVLFAGATFALLSCPTLRRRMGRASRQIASGHDADATFAQFEALYAQLRTPAPRPRVTSGSAYRPTVRANR